MRHLDTPLPCLLLIPYPCWSSALLPPPRPNHCCVTSFLCISRSQNQVHSELTRTPEITLCDSNVLFHGWEYRPPEHGTCLKSCRDRWSPLSSFWSASCHLDYQKPLISGHFELLTPSFLTSVPCSCIPNSLWGCHRPDTSALMPASWGVGGSASDSCPLIKQEPLRVGIGRDFTVLTLSQVAAGASTLLAQRIRIRWSSQWGWTTGDPKTGPQASAELFSRKHYH